jgi:anthranilate phosphoribosyltransferase
MTYTRESAHMLQTRILQGELSEEELLRVFETLDRPLEPQELIGFYEASIEAMTPVVVDTPCLDTCGTGGDGLNTFNISTAAAVVCAALGIPVAKHGNRSASGMCGSADVLEELGVPIMQSPEGVACSIAATNFGFMFAPNFHPAFKHAASVRKRFGKRTYFNLLGPLLNPARAAYRVVGISDPTLHALIGPTLLSGRAARVWVVHGADGMDEISPTGPATVWEYTPDGFTSFTIDPAALGIPPTPLTALAGGDRGLNASIFRTLLSGNGSLAQQNAVALTVAAGLVVTGTSKDYDSALHQAREVFLNPHLLQKTLAEITRFA